MSPPEPGPGGSPLLDLSVVIPVGPAEDALAGLLEQLAALPPAAELLVVGTEDRPTELPERVRWVTAPRGRGEQMNAGARAAVRTYLWFLHADSRLAPDTLPALERSLRAEPAALHYFDLRFLDDGPALMWLNEAGARFRSRVGGMPFGDQGFCLRRELWQALGGYRTDLERGEDHHLVWAARRRGVRLRATGGALRTSARRYRERGWLATTALHLRLTARQALPEWLHELRG